PQLPVRIGDRRGGGNHLGKARARPLALGAARPHRGLLAQQAASKPREDALQRRLEETGERAEALVEEMPFILNDEAGKWIMKERGAACKGGLEPRPSF